MTFLKNIFSRSNQSEKEKEQITFVFNTHKDKIYPWIKVFWLGDDDPRNTPIQIDLNADDSPIKKNWLGDLAILYVADMGNNFQVILNRDLPKDISEEQLHKIAIDNLNRDIEFKLHDTNFGGYGLVAGGDHEAGSICLPEVWGWLSEHLNDNLIVAIPAKDIVMLVRESDVDKISNLKIFVHEIFKKGERLLTKNIFRFSKDSKKWTIVDTVN